MNKRFLIIAACLLTIDAHASWYGGVNLGINSTNIKKNLDYPLAGTALTSANYHSGYSGFHGQLFAGYDFDFKEQISVAVEGNADLFTGRALYRINNWSFLANVNAKEKLENGFSIFLLPTYQMNPYVKVFAGPGVSTSRFIINSNDTAGNEGVSGHFSKWLVGGGLKAGAAASFTENLDLLFTYQFTQYQNASWTNAEPVSGEFLRGHYQPHAHIVMVGLSLHLPEVIRYSK
ncbi:OmpA-like transmembrane domain protein [Legionella nautarum]|uniref:OmpA-like transmembrane domain protein n=1 Tax=Legionella nautarum TaxID=45070 RepID=A0A0W0WLS6_9GAMM|nr:outer membrane beta-barrel protein [Legionella nautarum]KTD33271.1 OmpA-like transmembrane domain protein [Legionella nautarum]